MVLVSFPATQTGAFHFHHVAMAESIVQMEPTNTIVRKLMHQASVIIKLCFIKSEGKGAKGTD